MKKFLKYFLVVVLLVVGLALIFNRQIKNALVNQMTNSAVSSKIVSSSSSSKKANYDFKKITAVDNQLVVSAATGEKSDAIGKIAIPSVGLKLPIFAGLNNEDLVRGAGTMKEDQKMGAEGNYALAGHHMSDESLLFGPLAKTKLGDKIYLTDGKKVYVYKTTLKTVVNKSEVQYIYDVPGKKLLTLVTCASGEAGEVDRTIIQAELVSTKSATKANMKYFE
ncbi:class A sortase [Ligilactobacillus apodemi]|uniref:class A sortase n=1 Tax=Ligilactobacillus apodemi TaxID=307126 RepID=UPI00214BF6FE|nr:class A sortase [Ligilactobacillus apodemi]MCR1902244.1 class A sortase [Ligilactobacillus apodemi]